MENHWNKISRGSSGDIIKNNRRTVHIYILGHHWDVSWGYNGDTINNNRDNMMVYPPTKQQTWSLGEDIMINYLYYYITWIYYIYHYQFDMILRCV